MKIHCFSISSHFFVLTACFVIGVSPTVTYARTGCYQNFPEWDRASEVSITLRSASAISANIKAELLDRFSALQQRHDSYVDGTAPPCSKFFDFQSQSAAHEEDAGKFNHQLTIHENNVRQFINYGCAVIHPIEKNDRCVSWADQINTRKSELDNWAKRINDRKQQLDAMVSDINQSADAINSEWKILLNKFIADANAVIPKVVEGEVHRMVAILTDSPAQFVVADSNVQANPKPIHYLEYFEQVTKNADRIGEATVRYNVDPDLVRAIIWMESTRGYYDSVTGLVLNPKTLLPMNVYADYWIGFKVTREGLQDPEINIDTGTKILARIQARTSNSSISKVATLYGNLAGQKESEYGKTVEYYYNTKPWLKRTNN